MKGVLSAESGYTGGPEQHPGYYQVSAGRTGHTEAVRIVFDPSEVSYRELLYIYWRSVDPTVRNKQFCDSGSQYRTAIFYKGERQKEAVADSLKALQQSHRFAHIYTETAAASTFWPAEDYHQDYYKKNPVRYNFYRLRCGRDDRLKELWGDEAGSHKAPASIRNKS